MLGPEALLRETLCSRYWRCEGMPLAGAASLSTRAEERGARLWGGPDRTSEMGARFGFAGGAFELSLELRGQIALHLAARARRRGAARPPGGMRAGRTGPQHWMDALFAARLGAKAPREAVSPPLLEPARAPA